MNKLVLSFIVIFSLLSSCCEKDVYLEPDVVDQIVGIYEADISFFTLSHYKLKVVKIEDGKIRVVPFIGNEFRPFYANFKSEIEGKTLNFQIATGEKLFFDISSDPIIIDFKKGQRYYGHKIK